MAGDGYQAERAYQARQTLAKNPVAAPPAAPFKAAPIRAPAAQPAKPTTTASQKALYKQRFQDRIAAERKQTGIYKQNFLDSKKPPPTTVATAEDVARPIAATTAPTNPYDNPQAQSTSVAGHVNALLDPNAPLMKSAQYLAQQQANRFGLLNSTLAASAGTEAMIRTALPIASQDASQRQSLERQGLSQSAALQGMLGSHINSLQNAHTASVAQIQSAEGVDAATKTQLIKNLQKQRDADIAMTNAVYERMPAWQATWTLPGGSTSRGVIATPASMTSTTKKVAAPKVADPLTSNGLLTKAGSVKYGQPVGTPLIDARGIGGSGDPTGAADVSRDNDFGGRTRMA